LFLISLFSVHVLCHEEASKTTVNDSQGDPNAVLVLTTDTFDTTLSPKENFSDESWLIKFYAPWCSHCQALNPIFEKAAAELRPIVKLAKVDCTTDKDLCYRFGIQGYPTLKLIRGGKVYGYNQERSVSGFRQFVSETYTTVKALDFPKPGEALPTSGLSDFVSDHPYLFALAITGLVVFVVMFVYLIRDACSDDQEFQQRILDQAKLEQEKARKIDQDKTSIQQQPSNGTSHVPSSPESTSKREPRKEQGQEGQQLSPSAPESPSKRGQQASPSAPESPSKRAAGPTSPDSASKLKKRQTSNKIKS
jgi:protein disulfide-isomerase-like protein